MLISPKVRDELTIRFHGLESLELDICQRLLLLLIMVNSGENCCIYICRRLSSSAKLSPLHPTRIKKPDIQTEAVILAHHILQVVSLHNALQGSSPRTALARIHPNTLLINPYPASRLPA